MKYYTQPEYFPEASFGSEDRRYFYFYQNKEIGEVGYLFVDNAEFVPADCLCSDIIKLQIAEKKLVETRVYFGFYSEQAAKECGSFYWRGYPPEGRLDRGFMKEVTGVLEDFEGEFYKWPDKEFRGIFKCYHSQGQKGQKRKEDLWKSY